MMLKPKCVIRYEKRGLAEADTKLKFKEIITKTVNGVLNSESAKYIVSSCVESCIKGFEINFMFTDDESIRQINNEYRNINKSTDVLSFPINDFSYGQGAIDLLNTDEDTYRLLLGDIVISVPTMIMQAEDYGHSVDRECAFLVCHGMLHLLGYDHMNEKDEIQMFGYAEQILNDIGYTRN